MNYSLIFTVVAGKYDGQERNCKYRKAFATLDEAISACDQVREYPWVEIEYKGRMLQVIN